MEDRYSRTGPRLLYVTGRKGRVPPSGGKCSAASPGRVWLEKSTASPGESYPWHKSAPRTVSKTMLCLRPRGGSRPSGRPVNAVAKYSASEPRASGRVSVLRHSLTRVGKPRPGCHGSVPSNCSRPYRPTALAKGKQARQPSASRVPIPGICAAQPRLHGIEVYCMGWARIYLLTWVACKVVGTSTFQPGVGTQRRISGA